MQVTSPDLWWSYWYFHLPNYALAVLMYTLIGRFLLSVILKPDSPNYIFRWFRRLTDFLMPPLRLITPGYIHGVYLPLVGFYWLGMARLALFVVLYAAGLAPMVGHLPPGDPGGTPP
jgi:YggT family protein